MRIIAVALATLAFVTAAAAQQQPQLSPSNVAIQIDNIINQWAQQIEADQRTIAALQKENADMKAAAAPKADQPKN